MYMYFCIIGGLLRFCVCVFIYILCVWVLVPVCMLHTLCVCVRACIGVCTWSLWRPDCSIWVKAMLFPCFFKSHPSEVPYWLER